LWKWAGPASSSVPRLKVQAGPRSLCPTGAMADAAQALPGGARQYPTDGELEVVIGELLQDRDLAQTTVGQVRTSLEFRFGLAPGSLRDRMDRVKELIIAEVARTQAEVASRRCTLRRWRELRARARRESTPWLGLAATGPCLLGEARNRARGSLGRSIRAKAKPKARGSLGRALREMEAEDVPLLRDAAFGPVRTERAPQPPPYAPGPPTTPGLRPRGSYPVPRVLPVPREDE